MEALAGVAPTKTGFNPTYIPGCTLWLDADDASTITLSGSTVTTWKDKSGNGYNATSPSGPTYSNGSLVFNGSSNYFSTSLTIPANSHTLFAVHKPTSTSSNLSIFRFQVGAAPYIGLPYYNSTVGPRGYISSYDGTGVGSIDYANSTLLDNSSTTSFNIIEAVISSNSQQVYNGGVLQNSTTQTISSGTSPALYIGAWFSGTYTGDFYGGQINEIIVFNTTLTQFQRQQVEGYLAWKWGLQANLPYAQPYYFAPPTNQPNIFNPTQISGCSLWLDASDTSTITLSGSKVSQWNDKSGNNNNATQSTSAYQPTYSNGIVTFTESGSNGENPNRLNLPNGSIPYGNSKYSIFIALVPKVPTGSASRILSTGTLNGNQSTIVSINGNTAPTGYAYLSWYGPDYLLGTVTLGSKLLYEAIYDQTTQYGYLNGASSSSAVAPYSHAAQNTPVVLGTGPDNTNSAMMDLYEVIVYNTALTTTQRQQVEAYLSSKWGLTITSPSTTPFTNSNPNINFCPITDMISYLHAGYGVTTSGGYINGWGDLKGYLNISRFPTSTDTFSLNSSFQNGFPAIITPTTRGTQTYLTTPVSSSSFKWNAVTSSFSTVTAYIINTNSTASNSWGCRRDISITNYISGGSTDYQMLDPYVNTYNSTVGIGNGTTINTSLPATSIGQVVVTITTYSLQNGTATETISCNGSTNSLTTTNSADLLSTSATFFLYPLGIPSYFSNNIAFQEFAIWERLLTGSEQTLLTNYYLVKYSIPTISVTGTTLTVTLAGAYAGFPITVYQNTTNSTSGGTIYTTGTTPNSTSMTFTVASGYYYYVSINGSTSYSNVALCGAIQFTSSGVIDNQSLSYYTTGNNGPPSNLIDGNLVTDWSPISGGITTYNLTFSFSSSVTVGRVRVYCLYETNSAHTPTGFIINGTTINSGLTYTSYTQTPGGSGTMYIDLIIPSPSASLYLNLQVGKTTTNQVVLNEVMFFSF